MKVVIATKNQGKLKEFLYLAQESNYEFTMLSESTSSPDETGNNFYENALIKAEHALDVTGLTALADDSGLEVDYLDGRPGIYSARYANNNNEKLSKLLRELSDIPYRSAKFVSCMVLCDPEGNLVKDTTGICWGEILKEPRYPNGEFESIFWVKEANCVYGELSHSQLSKLGSRGKAAKNIAPFLKKEFGID